LIKATWPHHDTEIASLREEIKANRTSIADFPAAEQAAYFLQFVQSLSNAEKATLDLLVGVWTTEIFRKKKVKGICHSHPIPCGLTPEFYERLRNDCIISIEKTLELVKQIST
jgi:hypothetical protein